MLRKWQWGSEYIKTLPGSYLNFKDPQDKSMLKFFKLSKLSHWEYLKFNLPPTRPKVPVNIWRGSLNTHVPIQENPDMQIQFLGWEDPLDEEMANPLQYSCLTNSMDREAWQATVHGTTKNQTGLSSWAHTHMPKLRPKGNGNPLQYSCLENPMDGGAWRAAVHGVAEGRTRLSDFTLNFHFHALEKAMATHSSVLAWRIPGTGEPGGLPSMGSDRVGHDWSDLAVAQPNK